MKRFNFISSATILLMVVSSVFISCSKDGVDEMAQPVEKENKGVLFTMAEEQFGDDAEVRSLAQPCGIDTIDMGNGLEAEITIERDLNDKAAQTRALKTDNHYTIVAFAVGSGQMIGEIKGRFNLATGHFTADAHTNAYITLESGHQYNFVCYTDEYISRNGVTLTVPHTNAQRAMVARTTNVTILPQRQQSISFALKRLGARVRTRLVAAWPFTGVSGYISSMPNDAPAALSYNMQDGTQKLVGATTAQSATQTYVPTVQYSQPGVTFNSVISSNYGYYLAGTNSGQVAITFTGGALYNKAIPHSTHRYQSEKIFKGGGSYVLRVKLLPQYIYLFNDGHVGPRYYPQNPGARPIALMIGYRRGIALWNANSNQDTPWHQLFGFCNQYNPRAILENTSSYRDNCRRALLDGESGMGWTWDIFFYRHEGRNMIKANEPGKFPAFYYAAHFDLELMNRGIPLAPAVSGGRKWYLASCPVWPAVYETLTHNVWNMHDFRGQWNTYLADLAFTQVGGTPLTNAEFWTSAELSHEHEWHLNNVVDRHTVFVNPVWFGIGSISTCSPGEEIKAKVRPFIDF